MKSKSWILLISCLMALCLWLTVVLFFPGEASAAEVWSDGELIRVLPLNVPQTLTVTGKHGTNEITVSGGRVAVTHADCPDGYCMKRGWCAGGLQIVCLPNDLVIRFVGEQEVDGISG